MTQLLTTAGVPTSKPVAIRFKYDGVSRIVDNIDFDGKLIVGFEMRRGGKFSYKIKKYSVDKMLNYEFIPPPVRSGPKIGRPTA
jgi:hypothetical protein